MTKHVSVSETECLTMLSDITDRQACSRGVTTFTVPLNALRFLLNAPHYSLYTSHPELAVDNYDLQSWQKDLINDVDEGLAHLSICTDDTCFTVGSHHCDHL